MTNTTALPAELRDRAGKGAARATRREGKVPGVIYGAKQASVCIALDPRVLWAELRKPGFSTRLYEFDMGASGKHTCLARDVQFHPVTDQPLHVDFMRVDPNAVVHVKVPVHCVNHEKSPGIKRGGVLNIEHHEIEVTCIPHIIPKEITIDLTGFEIHHSVHVKDLSLPTGVKPYHLAEGATVVSIAPPTVSKAAGEAEG